MQDRMHTTTPHTRSDEVDIREVFAAIGRFFKRIGKRIVIAILGIRQATRKYAKLIIACMVVGAGIGYFSYKSFEPYYASELTITSRYYSNEMIKSAIEELNQLAGENNHTVLGRKLNISPEQSSVIRTFEVEPLVTSKDLVEVEALVLAAAASERLTEEQKEELKGRLLEDANSFRIITTVYDVSILDALEGGITAFLRDNDYIQRRVTIEQESLIAMRDKLLREQDRLERVKVLQAEAYGKLAESAGSGQNNVIVGAPTERSKEIMMAYEEDLLFTEELQKINEKLQLNQGLEIVSGFTPYGAPASLSLVGQLILGALIGLGVAYTIILLISINQALNQYEAKHISRKEAA